MSDDQPNAAHPAAPRLGADFRTRVGSAIAMIIIAAAATWLGGWWFAALVMVGGSIIMWEWANMTGGQTSGFVFLTQCVTIIAMIASLMVPTFWVGLLPLWAIAWTAGTVLVMWLAKDNGPEDAVTGLMYAALPCAGLVWLRNETALGLEAVSFLFVVVWATDILAYVTGRFFGGPKLWPAVSPKKTWSGALGGTAGAVIGALCMAMAVPGTWWVRIALFGLLLSVISQFGDLAESALKRHYDIKDSSNLIPGHGGVLDRVDGLLFATFAAVVYVLVFGSVTAPATSLLIGGTG